LEAQGDVSEERTRRGTDDKLDKERIMTMKVWWVDPVRFLQISSAARHLCGVYGATESTVAPITEVK
jgi:hypothetical protein